LRSAADLPMARACLRSLAAAEPGALLVLCNQGYLDTAAWQAELAPLALDVVIVGDGTNLGIAAGRDRCFRWLWAHAPNCDFVSEIHLDMLFPPQWTAPLVAWLEAHPAEPMVCAGILTATGELHPEGRPVAALPQPFWHDVAAVQALLAASRRDEVMAGFVHPVVHRASELRAVGGYDTRFLRGHQGYEDDSLLLGYRLRVGLRHDWRPRCWLGSRVFHATLAQRMSLPGAGAAFTTNLHGLLAQYGVAGLEQLSLLYPGNEEFRRLAAAIVEDLAAQPPPLA
jgi:hypothetical protein